MFVDFFYILVFSQNQSNSLKKWHHLHLLIFWMLLKLISTLFMPLKMYRFLKFFDWLNHLAFDSFCLLYLWTYMLLSCCVSIRKAQWMMMEIFWCISTITHWKSKRVYLHLFFSCCLKVCLASLSFLLMIWKCFCNFLLLNLLLSCSLPRRSSRQSISCWQTLLINFFFPNPNPLLQWMWRNFWL